MAKAIRFFVGDKLPYSEQQLNAMEPIRFWTPASISKSESAKTGKRIVHGIASTEDIDAQGERVLQEGIDYGPFLKSGFINFDHTPGPENIIGQPLEARITNIDGKPAMYVKAVLFEGVPRADAVWQLINTLEKGRAEGAMDRRMGWSVEGAVAERRGNLIAKSVVRHCALTHQPVAMGTFAELAKSLVKAQTVASSSSASDAPLLLQNLAGGKKSTREVCQALFGKNTDRCNDVHGGFRKSRANFVDHLVVCMGWSSSEARQFVVTMSGLLG